MILSVLYEDNHLLALDKPPGLLTQPSGTTQESLEDQAKQWLKQKYQKQGGVFLQAVHRLDKGAEGIVLFAKTSKAASRMSQAIREKRVKKFYKAKVERLPPHKEGVLEHYLLHDDYRAKVVSKGVPGAQSARLHYRVLVEEAFPLLEIDLETGRYHQIRVQLAAIGCPILGDKKYGSRVDWKGEGIALKHYRMEIAHPITGETLILNVQERTSWI